MLSGPRAIWKHSWTFPVSVPRNAVPPVAGDKPGRWIASKRVPAKRGRRGLVRAGTRCQVVRLGGRPGLAGRRGLPAGFGAGSARRRLLPREAVPGPPTPRQARTQGATPLPGPRRGRSRSTSTAAGGEGFPSRPSAAGVWLTSLWPAGAPGRSSAGSFTAMASCTPTWAARGACSRCPMGRTRRAPR